MKKINAILFVVLTSLLLSACSSNQQAIQNKTKHPEVTKPTYNLLKKSNQAIEDQNLNAYLACLVPSARAKTKKEIAPFLKNYQLDLTIDHFTIQKVTQNEVVAKVEQTEKAVKKPKKNKYKNHILMSTIIFKRIDGSWYIKQTVVNNNIFIE